MLNTSRRQSHCESPRAGPQYGKHTVADWFAIDWQTIEQDVRRLRQRIFTCLLEPDAVKVASPVLRGPGAVMRPAYPTLNPEPDTPDAS